MSTRTRRTPQERAAVILRAELKRLEAKAAKYQVAWDAVDVAMLQVRQALATLEESLRIGTPVVEGQKDDMILPASWGSFTPPEKDTPPEAVVLDMANTTNTPPLAETQTFETPVWDATLPRVAKRFVPTPLVPSPCPHPQTGMVDGVRRCLNPSCGRRVYSSVDDAKVKP